MNAGYTPRIVTLGIALFTIAGLATAATIKVTSTADSGAGTLRQALAKVSNGDTVDAGGVSGTITLITGELVVSNSVSIRGPGPANLTVNGGRTNRVFHVINGVSAALAGFTIYNGYATGHGGGILNNHSTLVVSNCTVTGNIAAGRGGGIGNDAVAGGNASLTVLNCVLSGNETYLDGGGIGSDSDLGGNATLTVVGSTFHENYGLSAGGGLDNYTDRNGTGIVLVSGCTFTRNKTGAGYLAGVGGAIANSAGLGYAAMTVSNCVLTSNYAWLKGSGGGIGNAGALAVIASTLNGNTATNNWDSSGGGIYNVGTLTVSTSTLSGNAASWFGGGIYNHGALTVSASTFYDNTANQGSGIGNIDLAGDSAPTVEIGDTILVSWDTGDTITNWGPGTVTSAGYNLSNDSGGGFLTGTGDKINTNPLLGPLQDNGGATFTHALLPGSPAIDQGNRNAVAGLAIATDQRGLPRAADFAGIVNAPGGDGSDIGAFEMQLCQYSIAPADATLSWSASAGTVTVTATGPNCEADGWTATNNVDWITITSGASGTGSGTVNYSVAPNTDCASRVGTLTIAGQTFTITQERAYGSHSLEPGNRAHGTLAESSSFTFQSGDNCNWTATSDVDWIHTSSAGSGSGIVEYSVETNYGTARSGNIHVLEAVSAITQAGNVLETLGGVPIVAAGEVVRFTPSMLGIAGNASSCLWSFGDGGASTDCQPSHVFTNCGAFPVSVVTSETNATKTFAVACAMSVTNFQAKLNFAKPNLDSCKFKCTPQPVSCTNLAGVVATLDVGGAQVVFPLDAKGRGVNPNGSCRLSYNQKSGICTFSVKLTRGAWQDAWAAHGLANGTYPKPGIPVTLPVILVIGNEAFMAEKPLHYTATAGKSGLAK